MMEKSISVNIFRVVDDLCPFVQIDYMDKYAEEHTGLMILDSGSTVNVLSKHMVEQISELCKIHNETTEVLTVTNELIATDSVRFSFVFGGIQYCDKFCIYEDYQCEKVEDIPIIGILGNEFMQKHSLVIDYNEYTLHSSNATPENLNISECDFFFPMGIGLDYYGDHKGKEDYELQKKWFIAEINLAKKLDLPIVVHSRDACKDTLDIIKTYAKGLTGIIHCFSYEKEVALEYVDMGYCIGVGGVVTFKNGRKLKEVVEAIPIENIVAETDAPWLTPMPYRGKRNESDYIKYVIEEIAKIKNIDVETTAEVLYNNALEVYGL